MSIDSIVLNVQSSVPNLSRSFDVVTLVMAILELPALEPFASILPRVLKPNTGRFVAVNLHPAFSKPGAHRVIEVLENPNTGNGQACA